MAERGREVTHCPDINRKPPVRILVVIRWPVGGIRTFLEYVYKYFRKQKYEFTILLPAYLEHEALVENLAPLSPKYILLNERCGAREVLTKIMTTISSNKIDIVHSHGLTAGIYSCIAARLMRVPHITTVHEVLRRNQFAIWRGRILMAGLSVVLPWIDGIHTVSKDAAENLLEYVPRLRKFGDKLTVIPNGIDVDRFLYAKKRDLRAELGLDKAAFLIGFLGRFMPEKGFGCLVEAMQILTNDLALPKKPVLLAFGGGGFVREERQSIREKDLDGSITIMPFTKEAASTLKGLDVLVMPSLREAYPLLAMEAMVAGVPVIGSDCIGLREVLKKPPAAMIKAGDSAALAKALLAEIQTDSRSKAKAFAREAASRFDAQPRARELERVFLNLVKSLSPVGYL